MGDAVDKRRRSTELVLTSLQPRSLEMAIYMSIKNYTTMLLFKYCCQLFCYSAKLRVWIVLSDTLNYNFKLIYDFPEAKKMKVISNLIRALKASFFRTTGNTLL